jgi:hypothetical protein
MVVWTGIYEVDQQIMSEAETKGQKLNLWVADLKTGKTVKIDSANPHHVFNLKWLDANTLEYVNSAGATTTYTYKE